MEIPTTHTHHAAEAVSRPLVKTITYRAMIVILDFLVIYIFTHQAKIAFGFMQASNVYTTLDYFLHERIWDHIKWGKKNSEAFRQPGNSLMPDFHLIKMQTKSTYLYGKRESKQQA